jgi:hypothetical protein
MSWFPELEKDKERVANLPHSGRGGNRHGESIMIDVSHA